MNPDGTIQSAVRRAVVDVTGRDERLRVTHTLARTGWGDVLYVEVYAHSHQETLDDLDPELRKIVSVVADQPFERVVIRWRISH